MRKKQFFQLLTLIAIIQICIMSFFARAETNIAHENSMEAETTEKTTNTQKKIDTKDIYRIRIIGRRNLISNPREESPGLEHSKSLITEEEFESKNADTITESMKYSPGAWIETRGRKLKQFISFRGQKYPYPGYSINGTYIYEFPELPYYFSPMDLERVEVIRSSAALLTGPSGLTGVINLVPRVYVEPQVRADIQGGMHNTYKFRISHGASHKSMNYMINMNNYHTEGPRDMHAKENLLNVGAHIGWAPNKKITFELNTFHLHGKRELRNAGENQPVSAGKKDTKEVYDPLNAFLVNLRAWFSGNEKCSTEITTYFSHRNNHFINYGSSGHPTHDDKDWEFGINAIHSQKIGKINTLRAAVNYSYWHAPYGKRFYEGFELEQSTIAGVLIDELDFGKVKADMGVKVSGTYNHNFSPAKDGWIDDINPGKFLSKFQTTENEWNSPLINANLGIKYDAMKNLDFSLNTAFGILPAPKGSLITNITAGTSTETEDEKRLKIDAGIRLRHPKAGYVVTTFFYTKRFDGIKYSTVYNTNNGYYYHENTDMDTIGIELDIASVKIVKTFSLFANLTYMYHRIHDGNAWIRDKEKPAIITSFGIRLERWGVDCNFFGKYVGLYESTRFVSPASLGAQNIGNYITLNLILGYKFGKKQKLRLYCEIENMTDNKYVTCVGYPDFGIRVNGGIQYSLR